MDLEFLIFPHPKCSYSVYSLGKELIWIPIYEDNVNGPIIQED